ncbi:hypothetical protein POVWA1_059750 [Plasmodium ovale wallikeri]|nr:hypothetical protein POVWA1_059750 [Plasmodium ovale wallikeri]
MEKWKNGKMEKRGKNSGKVVGQCHNEIELRWLGNVERGTSPQRESVTNSFAGGEGKSTYRRSSAWRFDNPEQP